MRRVVIGVVLVALAGCGWAQGRFDAANSGHNPFETVIDASTVSRLEPQYRMVSSIPDGVPTFVVAHGHVYVDGGPVRAFDEFGSVGCSGTPRVCAPQWSYATGRFPTVVDDVLYLESQAFDPDGVRNCSGAPKSCTPLWYESATSLPPGPFDPDHLHLGFTSTSGHGSEAQSVVGYPTTCTVPQCAPAWRAALGSGSPGGVLGGPARLGSTIYASYSAVGAPSGSVAAFDGSSAAATRRWTGLVPGVAGPYVAAGGGVVVVNANTTGGAALFAFDAAGVRNCTRAVPNVCLPVWQTDAVSIGFERPPAIADGVVYRVIGNQLRAYDASGSTGCAGTPRVCQRLWIADAGPGATAPAVANGLVYTSANDGFVEAFDAEGATNCSATTRVCSAIWSADVNVNLGTVEVADGRLFVAAGDGSVRVFGLPAP